MDSIQTVLEHISIEEKILGSTEKVFIGGFQEGGAVSIATFLHYEKQLGGVIGLGGKHALKVDKETFNLAGKDQSPFFLYHETYDSMNENTTATESYEPFA